VTEVRVSLTGPQWALLLAVLREAAESTLADAQTIADRLTDDEQRGDWAAVTAVVDRAWRIGELVSRLTWPVDAPRLDDPVRIVWRRDEGAAPGRE
jgi:hypothetical protein